MQRAYATLSSVACPALQYFPHYLVNDAILEKVTEHNFFLFYSLELLFETFVILRRNERDVTINVYWSSCKVPVILVRFHRSLKFLNRFSKNNQITNFKKINLVGAELFHAVGQTDIHDEANSRFSQFCEGA